jgi:hypothetical protein
MPTNGLRTGAFILCLFNPHFALYVFYYAFFFLIVLGRNGFRTRASLLRNMTSTS